MIASLIARFIAPYGMQLAIAGALAFAAGGAFLALKHKYHREGYDAAIAAIAAKNEEAEHAADAMRARIRACRDGGRVWSQTAGECVGAR